MKAYTVVGPTKLHPRRLISLAKATEVGVVDGGPQRWAPPILGDGRLVAQREHQEAADRREDGAKRVGGPSAGDAGRFELAANLYLQLITAKELAEFLTLAAYEHI